jgi:hypothetical protein
MTITMVRWIRKTIAPTQRDLQTPTSKVARTAMEMPSATKPTSAQTSMENPTTTEMGAQIRTAMAFQMLNETGRLRTVLTSFQKSPRNGATAMVMVSGITKVQSRGMIANPLSGSLTSTKMGVQTTTETAIQTKATRVYLMRKTPAGLPSQTIPQRFSK